MKTIFCIILIFICIAGLKAQVPQVISDSLQNILELYQGVNSIPGISAAVNIYDIGTWTGATGESFENTPLTPDMLMGIGSNTKTFTAALILKFAEQGIVSLNDSLYQWLPNFTNIDSTVTIKQLLRHNSGIADFWTTAYVNAIFANPDSVWSREDVLNFVGLPLFSPGTNVAYSNTNFTLAGMTIEAAEGEEYSTLIRTSILTQLNLNNTFLEGFETISGISAHPWHMGEDVYLIPRTAVTTGAFAAGCMKSTPENMVLWFDQLFNQNFLSENSLAEMTDFIDISGSVNGVGCGILRMNYNSKTYYFHSGNIRGYSSYTMYDVEDKHSISVLRNDTFVNCENVAKALANSLIELTLVKENQFNLTPEQIHSIQNYPNPFNSSTTISFQLSDFSNQQTAELVIYNLKGQKIKIFSNLQINKSPNQQIVWDGTDQTAKPVSSGIYLARLKVGKQQLTKKMLLIK